MHCLDWIGEGEQKGPFRAFETLKGARTLQKPEGGICTYYGVLRTKARKEGTAPGTSIDFSDSSCVLSRQSRLSRLCRCLSTSSAIAGLRIALQDLILVTGHAHPPPISIFVASRALLEREHHHWSLLFLRKQHS